MKCASTHLSTDCLTKDKITPKCTNFVPDHPSTYTGCIKNPLLKKKQFLQSKSQDKYKQNYYSEEAYNFVEKLKDFIHTTNSKMFTHKPADCHSTLDSVVKTFIKSQC